MHPSPAALMSMSDSDLHAYHAELRTLALDSNEDFNGPYRNRKALVEAILADRNRGQALAAMPVQDFGVRAEQEREALRTALAAYKQALNALAGDAEGAEREDVLVSLAQVDSAARVLWFESGV